MISISTKSDRLLAHRTNLWVGILIAILLLHLVPNQPSILAERREVNVRGRVVIVVDLPRLRSLLLLHVLHFNGCLWLLVHHARWHHVRLLVHGLLLHLLLHQLWVRHARLLLLNLLDLLLHLLAILVVLLKRVTELICHSIRLFYFKTNKFK